MLAGAVVHQIELHQRRAAEAVDEAAAPGLSPCRPRSPTIAAQISSAMASALFSVDAAAARLAMDADAHLHLAVADVEGRLAGRGHGAGLVSATPIERVAPLTRSPSAFSCFERHALLGRRTDDLLDHQRAGDAAPAGGVGRVLDRDIVIGDHVAMSPSDISAAMSKFITSPS